MDIENLKSRFQQLYVLKFPTTEDLSEIRKVGEELIRHIATAPHEVVMTKELITGRIQRVVMRYEMNNPTAEDLEAVRQGVEQIELLMAPDDGVRH